VIKSLAPVSVIVPCYRCVDTIERALESVWQQTSRPAEVILIDDYSCDNTLLELYRLQKYYGDDWIKIVEHKNNGGPSVARNSGWTIAAQPYLAFLDADDSWHPRKIELQYVWMSEHPEVALTGHDLMVLRGNEKLPKVTVPLPANQVSAKSLLISNRFSTPTVMLKRKLDLRFEPDKRCSEDYLLWLSIVFQGYAAYRFEGTLAYLYKGRFGEGGLSGNLWEMEKGQLDTYHKLFTCRYITRTKFGLLCCYSLLKFLRRFFIKALS